MQGTARLAYQVVIRLVFLAWRHRTLTSREWCGGESGEWLDRMEGGESIRLGTLRAPGRLRDDTTTMPIEQGVVPSLKTV